MSDVAERVKKIVVEHLGVDGDKVKTEEVLLMTSAPTASTRLSSLWLLKKNSPLKFPMTLPKQSRPLAMQ